MDQQHPWLKLFATNPHEEIGRLLGGLATVDEYRRADPPDIADLVFGPLGTADPLRQILSEALTHWLTERRSLSLVDRAACNLDTFVSEVADAFRIVWRLELVDTAQQLRREFQEWDSWTRPLVLAPSRDARLTFLRLCALMQSALQDEQLEAVWIGVCKEAGRALPDYYLEVGLLGLGRMPSAEAAVEPARRVVRGLAIWAQSAQPSRKSFLREWRRIKYLFPLSKGVWQDIVDLTIRSVQSGATRELQAARWWRNDVGLNEQLTYTRQQSGARPPIGPTKKKAEEVVQRLKNEKFSDSLMTEVEQLISKAERYAIATGDADQLIRLANKVASQLTRWHGPNEAAYASALARLALTWDSENPFSWASLHKSVALQGDRDGAELIAWEAIRRFPHQIYKRILLANFLAADPTRHVEAEALLREALKYFPDDEFVRNQLAGFLASDSNRLKEARDLLIEQVELFPNDAFGRNQLLSILSRLPDEQVDREVVLRDTISKIPDDPAARNQLANILIADPLRKNDAEALLRETIEKCKDTLAARIILIKLLLNSKRFDDAEVEFDYLERTAVEAPYFALRARWAIQSGKGTEAAHKWLETGLKRFPGNRELVQKLDKLEKTNSVDDNDELDSMDYLLEVGINNYEKDGRSIIAAESKSSNTFNSIEDKNLTDVGPYFDKIYKDAARYGRARRADFALNGAGLDEVGREDAKIELQKLLEEDEFFIYGQLIHHRRVDTSHLSAVLEGLGRSDVASTVRAWHAQDASCLQALAHHGEEQLLAHCAHALIGDESAVDRFSAALESKSKREGRGSRVLRSLLQPLFSDEKNLESEQKSTRKIILESRNEISHALNSAIDASFEYSFVAN